MGMCWQQRAGGSSRATEFAICYLLFVITTKWCRYLSSPRSGAAICYRHEVALIMVK
jgi:hypothetical protein